VAYKIGGSGALFTSGSAGFIQANLKQRALLKEK
jgi:hypothetical protein